MDSKLFTLILFFVGGVFIAFTCNKLLLSFSRSLGIRNKNNVVVRWSSESKPSLGGVSFFVVFIFASMTYAAVFNSGDIFDSLEYIGFLLAGSLAFGMGLTDDAYDTKPLFKLAIQIACGLALGLTGTYINIFDSYILNLTVTVVWVIILMNSLNMLDNMDGITGTTVFFILISCLVVNWLLRGFNIDVYTIILMAMLGGVSGFLSMNIHPSKLFMGDAGSQFIALFVAFYSIEYLWNSSAALELPSVLGAFAVLVAFTPAAVDTLTVVINRLKQGKSPMVGGKDHTTHHLVYAGMNDKQVWYVFVVIGLLATLFSILMIVLMKKGFLVAAALFLLYFLLAFYFLYRNTLKYPEPKKK